jgi:glycosyltransferase involved in cell wall biosynthesis
MGQDKPLDIVVTTWNREWMTDLCLNVVAFNTQTPHRVILVDSGSNGNSRTRYAAQADVYVKLDKNYGLEYAKNIGMQFVESPLFVSMDNDILPYKYDPDWLSQLVGLMDKYPDYGAIALRPQTLVGTSLAMFDTEDEVVPFPHVPGYARIMRTDLVKETGAWNDKRPLRGHEEMWVGEKFAERGFKMGWSPKLHCYHLWGRDDEDMWGYKNTESGHNPVWPIYHNDKEEIRKGTGIEI